MPYVLGIDIGTSHTSAAIRTLGAETWSEPVAIKLGARSMIAPSVLYLDEDGYLLTGERAWEAGAQLPERLITGFHERIGDDVPVVVAGEPLTPESLSAVVAGWIVEQVARTQRGSAAAVILTHPGDWGPYRCGVLLKALRDAGIQNVTATPGPLTAAGAAALACRQWDDAEGDAAETTLLPRITTGPGAVPRPERPPVDITPFPLPEKKTGLKFFGGYRGKFAPAAVVAAAIAGLLFSFEGQVTSASSPMKPHGSASPQTAATCPAGRVC
ncbi:MAG: molecular chaperone DnaK-like protein [Amycolatopsis sp.]|uniref:hypothetical protein n=1 Tax=Amycolatopsis sp. TaxID=37632 RepID=UPI00260CE711|nr:hypothetical protein [Amycolatopsis sp.]MCU1685386.1 molecular chaperone DnaK-like protein [Amycolatopsis sp.]